ncbi:S8 family serine peptidase [Emticicia sp. BO119]|uniref:S8 family peptidase n=1 Tax=Emticicia sp. BO119 TaxID=2757768 RepID=UPI0015F024B9|nr:S8 family serine peptidase [Emticicia sp. BO119]MBA4853500.1 S8 family serine peptidase [Emticicia sp. BO119]
MRTQLLLFSSVLLFLSGNFIFAQTIDKDYVDGEVYIKLKEFPKFTLNLPNGAVNMAQELPFLSKAAHISEVSGVKRAFYFSNVVDLQRVYRLKISNPKLLHQFIKEIEKDKRIEYIERVPFHQIISVPSDPKIGNQYYLSKIKAYEAWDISQGGVDLVVAVVDNAIQVNHIDLAANILPGRDISDNDNDPSPPDSTFFHGTHVAGLVGAVTNNNNGIASVGINRVKILPIKVTPDSGDPQSVYHGFEGIEWAVAHGANIINISWGGSGYSLTDQAVIDNAYNSGVIIIAAAGNNNQNTSYYPASYNHVISVGSVTSNDEKSYFSNYGSSVDLVAPGSGIYSTIPTNKYDYWSGTSMAAPIVSSIFAYVWSVKPNLNPAQLENLIKSTCDNIDIHNSGYIGLLGSGRVNVLKAISCMEDNIQPVINPSATNVLCSGGMVQLSCNTYEGASYQWKKNGVNIGSNQPAYNASETGQYTVIVTKNTCTIAASSVKVSVVPDSVVINVASTIACVGDSILLSVSNLEGINYQWKKDGLDIGTGSFQLYAKQNGYYTVSLSGNNCTTTSPAVNVSFITLNPSIISENSTVLCLGQSTTLFVNGISNANYQWKKDNQSVNEATDLSFTASEAGEYYVEQKSGQCIAKSNQIKITITTQSAQSPGVVGREICEGKSLSAGNGLQATADMCMGSVINSYSYTGGVVAYDGNERIGDNPSINITDLGTNVIGKIKVSITFEKKDQEGLNACSLPHGGGQPYNDEISFRLKSPNGTIISLLQDNTYNYYSYGGQVVLTFEDGKPSITPQTGPVSGIFAPSEELAFFNGQIANGTWTLLPNDNSSGDPLCVSAFSIDIQVDNVILPNTFSWWNSPTDGKRLGIGSEFIASDTLAGIHTYYVQNQCSGVCPSIRVPVNLSINTAAITPPSVIAYTISSEIAAQISPLLSKANMSNQNPVTIQNGSYVAVISDRAPLVNPVTVCNGTKVLLLGVGCNGDYQWLPNSDGVGIIISPTLTNSYSVRCREQSSGCWTPYKEQIVHVKPVEVMINNHIPQRGLQTFVGKRITATTTVSTTSDTSIKADNSIVFLPGFSVDTNSVFTARIEDGCAN